MANDHSNSGKVVSLATAALRPRRSHARGLHVLVVSEHAADRLLVEQLLKLEGYSTSSVEYDEAALDFVAQHSPHAVLVDFDASPTNAVALVQGIRLLRIGNSPLPVIALASGAVSNEINRRARENGVKRFITRPISAPMLLEALGELTAPKSQNIGETPLETQNPYKALRAIASYDDDAFVRSFVKANFNDMQKQLVLMEALIFRPDASRMRDYLHGLQGLALNVDAQFLASKCQSWMSFSPLELTSKIKEIHHSLKTIVQETQAEVDKALGHILSDLPGNTR